MWQRARLGFVAETGSFVAIDALSTIFLLFFFLHFSPSLLSRCVSLFGVASSVQQSFSLQQVRVCFVSFVLCAPSPNSFLSYEYLCVFMFLVLVVFFLLDGVLLVLSYPSTLAR